MDIVVETENLFLAHGALDEKGNKIAAFDIDHTIVKPINGKTFFNKECDFEFVFPNVVEKLSKLSKTHTIVFFSNHGNVTDEYKNMLTRIYHSFPFIVMISKDDDNYRKPRIGMMNQLKKIIDNFDLKLEYFVGDAAGRVRVGYAHAPTTSSSAALVPIKGKKDFSDTDLKFALNLNVPFLTPEQFFLDRYEEIPIVLTGFNAKEHAMIPYNPPDYNNHEIILFVGKSSSGKTTFFKTFLEPFGYIHVNQDTLKTKEKCIKKVKEICGNGKLVIDNTNPDTSTRKLYVDIAKSKGIPIYCYHFIADKDLCLHNNYYRMSVNGARRVPQIA
jgi:bifunctional polynucleotide phosphatase/kinase